jgi:hypothetical protein
MRLLSHPLTAPTDFVHQQRRLRPRQIGDWLVKSMSFAALFVRRCMYSIRMSTSETANIVQARADFAPIARTSARGTSPGHTMMSSEQG